MRQSDAKFVTSKIVRVHLNLLSLSLKISCEMRVEGYNAANALILGLCSSYAGASTQTLLGADIRIAFEPETA